MAAKPKSTKKFSKLTDKQLEEDLDSLKINNPEGPRPTTKTKKDRSNETESEGPRPTTKKKKGRSNETESEGPRPTTKIKKDRSNETESEGPRPTTNIKKDRSNETEFEGPRPTTKTKKDRSNETESEGPRPTTKIKKDRSNETESEGPRPTTNIKKDRSNETEFEGPRPTTKTKKDRSNETESEGPMPTTKIKKDRSNETESEGPRPTTKIKKDRSNETEFEGPRPTTKTKKGRSNETESEGASEDAEEENEDDNSSENESGGKGSDDDLSSESESEWKKETRRKLESYRLPAIVGGHTTVYKIWKQTLFFWLSSNNNQVYMATPFFGLEYLQEFLDIVWIQRRTANIGKIFVREECDKKTGRKFHGMLEEAIEKYNYEKQKLLREEVFCKAPMMTTDTFYFHAKFIGCINTENEKAEVVLTSANCTLNHFSEFDTGGQNYESISYHDMSADDFRTRFIQPLTRLEY